MPAQQLACKVAYRQAEIRLSDTRSWATLMIRSFATRETELLFLSQAVGRFGNMERVARRKLLMIHAATRLSCLRVPPGNRLEALRGVRTGQYSIRINDQWRICFRWQDDGAYEVEIVDYH
jgi:toxin HigB-1